MVLGPRVEHDGAGTLGVRSGGRELPVSGVWELRWILVTVTLRDGPIGEADPGKLQRGGMYGSAHNQATSQFGPRWFPVQ